MEEAKEYKKYLKGLKKATEKSPKKDFKVKNIRPISGIQGLLLSRSMTSKKDGGRIKLKGGGICKKGMNREAVGKNS